VRAFCFGRRRRVCRLPSVVCLSRVRSRKLREIRAKFRRPYRKSGSPSKNMTSDFVPKLAKYPKGAANPKIVQNSVRAYCLALLSDADQISTLSQPCYYHIHQLRCIRPYLDFKTAFTIATSIVHSKLDYCNSLYYNLPKSQITRLQQIQNSLARAVVKAPKFCHITPILHSLHWLKITERIEYKILSLTYSSDQCSTFLLVWGPRMVSLLV